MKIGVVYNVFDGEELLEGSIRQIRDYVSYIVCVTQYVSNHGNKYMGGIYKCDELKEKGLVDEVRSFIPNGSYQASKSETNKRNLGLESLKDQGCTHYILMDCDEYYDKDDFKLIKDAAKIHDYTYAPLKTYFGKPEYQITPIENYYVPAICKLSNKTRVGNYGFGGIYCDPTRKDSLAKKPYNMGSWGVSMHHYSWIRKDLDRKIDNSSAKVNLIKYKDDIIKACENPENGMEIPFYKGHRIKYVKDHFNISRFL